MPCCCCSCCEYSCCSAIGGSQIARRVIVCGLHMVMLGPSLQRTVDPVFIVLLLLLLLLCCHSVLLYAAIRFTHQLSISGTYLQ